MAEAAESKTDRSERGNNFYLSRKGVFCRQKIPKRKNVNGIGKRNRKFPTIDNGRCSLCEGCVSVAPEVFFFDENIGRMRVMSLPEYPEERVEDAIKNCPKDCISWDMPIEEQRNDRPAWPNRMAPGHDKQQDP